MSVTVVLPGQLRELAGGRSRVELGGGCATVRDALEALRGELPAVYDRIITERLEVRPHVNVFVGSDNIRWSDGLDTPLGDGSELFVLPSVSGG